jgi:hypothetical protein
MKNLFIFLTLLLTSPLFAQVDFRKEYYPAINRAEMAITKDDYQTAFSEYQTAFFAVKSPLARDIFNAVACKFLLNDFDGAKPLLLKLAKKGISVEVLEKQEVFMLDNVKAQWNTYKFLYVQIQSMQQEQISADLVEIMAVLTSKSDSLRDNVVVISFDENGNQKGMKSKDYKEGKFGNVLTKEEILQHNLKNSKTSNELYTYAQKVLVDYVISNGLISEEKMFIDDSDFFRNNFAWFLERFRIRVNFRLEGGYSFETIPFSSIPEGKKKLFDSKIFEAVKKGEIHRDLALELLFGYKSDNKLLFTKINIENIENCSLELKERTYSLFYYKKTGPILDDESQRTLEELRYGDSELIFEKAKYKILKNSYFSMSSDAQMEETTVPNCEIAKQFIEKATKIQD